jgi:hypothetical protein
VIRPIPSGSAPRCTRMVIDQDEFGIGIGLPLAP